MIANRPSFRGQLRVRFLLCIVVVSGVFGILGMRLAYLQVIHGARYRYLSENNRIRLERIPAPRGMILDSRGEILADVRAAFDAMVIPAEIPRAKATEVYAELSETLSLPVETVAEIVEGPGLPRWKPRILKRRLGRAQMARLEAHRLELPGVRVHANPVRHYPSGELMGGTLGYVGEISSRELESPAFAEYEPGDPLGRGGIEWAWEGTLRGGAGGQQVEVDARGRKLAVLAERSAKPGRNLVLTVDRRLQEAAEGALGDRVGAVVVLDVASGDVLAMVSKPNVDSNLLAGGVSTDEWNRLIADPRHPLQNRAIQGQYPPGSTFKIVMALAGLAEGVITPSTEVFCPGALHFAGRAYRCWKRVGHGPVDLERALIESCDVYFYQLGIDLGVDSIHARAVELGLGKPTGIDLPGEKGGLIPSKPWKRKVLKEPWYSGETLSVAIGQGYVLTTPLQLATMAAAVAHPHGTLMRPRIVARIEDAEGRPLEEIRSQVAGKLGFQSFHLDRVRNALRQVVAGDRGTGKKAEVEGFPVAGKTGTAQVVRLPGQANIPDDEIPWERRDHALFVCYAPFDEPQIAVAVVVEHGGHGGAAAAPVARQVLGAYHALRLEGVSYAEPKP